MGGVIVKIGGPVKVTRTSFDGSVEEEVTDTGSIRAFDGRVYLDVDSDGEGPVELSIYLQDGRETRHLYELGLRGGVLRYEYRDASDELWIVAEFAAPRELDEGEAKTLVDFMAGQWYDGAGEAFSGELTDENEGLGPLGHPTVVYLTQSREPGRS